MQKKIKKSIFDGWFSCAYAKLYLFLQLNNVSTLEIHFFIKLSKKECFFQTIQKYNHICKQKQTNKYLPLIDDM
jgi:hypothetical protein